MTEGQTYKHVNCRDVAIFVLKVFRLEKYLKVKISWVNVVNPKNHWIIGVHETVKIKREDLKNWKRIKTE